MNLELIQFSAESLYSVYIIRNYLPKEEMLKLDNHIRKLTNEDSMNRETNVKANMTSFEALQDSSKCGFFFQKIAHSIDAIIKLRGGALSVSLNYDFVDSWGMRHKPGDYTIQHTHNPFSWSGAYYTHVSKPEPFVEFIEFDSEVKLETNMLILFPGTVVHKVSKNESNEDRISMAFNINIEK